jgi:PAS domain S-box-containing protein
MKSDEKKYDEYEELVLELDMARILFAEEEEEEEARIVVSIKDITERKRAEEALRESEERYKNLFQNNHAVMLIIDPGNAAILDVNPAACVYYGWSREELLKKKIDEINMLTPVEVYAEMQLARTEKRNHFIFKHRRADGSIRDVGVYSGPLFMAGKDLLYSIVHDITESKRAEEALRQSESQLRALSLELSFSEERERKRLALYLHDEIGQSLALLRMKFGGLTGIWGSKSAKQNIQQIRGLLEKVIDQTHTLTFELSPPVLHQLGLEAAIEWAGEKISQDHGIEFMFSDDGRMKPIDADHLALVFRCVRELMMNIAKHAKARKMTVSLRRTENQFTAVVEDNGIGFEAPLSERQPEKVGFGLLSVREHLGAVGGSYEFQSEPGRGTSITLSVPIKEDKRSS